MEQEDSLKYYIRMVPGELFNETCQQYVQAYERYIQVSTLCQPIHISSDILIQFSFYIRERIIPWLHLPDVHQALKTTYITLHWDLNTVFEHLNIQSSVPKSITFDTVISLVKLASIFSMKSLDPATVTVILVRNTL